MNEVLEAINTIRAYFENLDNFKTTTDKLQGILVSKILDSISDNFVKTCIEPDIKENISRQTIIDIGAEA